MNYIIQTKSFSGHLPAKIRIYSPLIKTVLPFLSQFPPPLSINVSETEIQQKQEYITINNYRLLMEEDFLQSSHEEMHLRYNNR